jgi:predicted PurR-regulated permease PerM
MTRQQLVAFGFFGVLLVLLYQLAEVFSLFLRPLLWAVILAHVTFPLHTRLTGLLRGREVASAALLTVGIVALKPATATTRSIPGSSRAA